MRNTRIIFMGTPVFSKHILQTLVENGYNIIALISQPDREVGRKRIMTSTPTKEYALTHNIPVYQKEKIRLDFEFVRELKPDLIITCAYGQIIPQEMLDIPPLGCINLHASLLPQLRGGAPIQRAIMEGYPETGITLMQMIKQMDAGLMYKKVATSITDEDTYDTLALRLQDLAAKLILSSLDDYINGELIGIPQDESQVTFAMNIKREEEHLDFARPSRKIFDHVRGLCSTPGTYAIYNQLNIKIFAVQMSEDNTDALPGTIIRITSQGIFVKTLDGAIIITDFQTPGKSRMLVRQYLNGNSMFKISTRFA